MPGPAGLATVLVVCRANICRSPATTLLLGRAAEEALLPVAVSSAGVSVRPGIRCCSQIAALLPPGQDLAALVEQHRSRQVDVASMQADLVLAADRSVRADLARRFPDAVSRIFTVREAASLAATPPLAPASAPPGAERSAWSAFGQAMDEQRIGSLPRGPSRWPRLVRSGRDPAASLDVGDAHAPNGPRHKDVAAELSAAVEALVGSLVRWRAG